MEYIDKLKQDKEKLEEMIDKTKKILQADTYVEEIYWALCTLYEIDDYSDIISREIKEILDEDTKTR